MENTSSEPPAGRRALPAAPSPADAPAGLDANGFNPADYKWVPVLRRPRCDGWTPERQVRFIAALADTGLVTRAASEAGMSVNSCYRLRRSPGGEKFAAAWDAARSRAGTLLIDVAFERALNGSNEPVFDRKGNRVGRRIRYNDKLLMQLLRAYAPERFRPERFAHAHHSVRQPGEPPPTAVDPLDEALSRLELVPPQDPHLLMPPDELDDELGIADELNGELPSWYGGRGARPGTDEDDDDDSRLTELRGDPFGARPPGEDGSIA